MFVLCLRVWTGSSWSFLASPRRRPAEPTSSRRLLSPPPSPPSVVFQDGIFLRNVSAHQRGVQVREPSGDPEIPQNSSIVSGGGREELMVPQISFC